MCDHHNPWGAGRPWREEADLAPRDCLYFGDLDGICRNPESPHCLGRCPQKGRAPGEVAARERQAAAP